jgi:DNA polymerase-3 subunit alpha
MPKIVSKKLVKEAVFDEKGAGALFDMIAGFAGYGFNKSHSVEYALISYQVAYLKVYYPVEFYAAALSLMDDDKLPALIADAKISGIGVETPDVNLSSDKFEILTDTRLSIPFGRIKGLSSNAAKAIVEARVVEGRHVPFTSVEEFTKRVNRRLVNSAKIDILDKIGAFARIQPGSKPASDPSRIKDQRDLIPGLITDVVPVDRDMRMDRLTIKRLIQNINDYREKLADDGIPVRPSFSLKSKVMVIFDSPSTGRNSEESNNSMARGDGFAWQATAKSMGEVGFSVKDLYITALLKRPKASKTISSEEIDLYSVFLREEIDLLKPPVIVTLGAAITRWFLPDLKGKVSDHAGEIIYSKDFDANIVVGFNPGEIYFSPEKQEALTSVFAAANGLVSW